MRSSLPVWWLRMTLGLIAISGSAGEINAESASSRREWLQREIAAHDVRYFQEGQPVISDAEYDALKQELRQLQLELPGGEATVVDGHGIGDDRLSGQRLHRHLEPMLSLDKAHTTAALAAFHARLARQLGRDDLDYLVEPKYDGIAVSLVYEHGQLVRAVTRGNGEEGADVTTRVRLLASLPQRLRETDANAVPACVELRGEIHVAWADFRRLNDAREAAGDPPWAHPRSVAAGAMKAGLPDPLVVSALRLVVHGVGAFEPVELRPVRQRELYLRLEGWGVPGVQDVRRVTGGAALEALLDELGAGRTWYPFPSDGWVAKLDVLAQQREVGQSRTAPRWAIARKFPPERVRTRLQAVTWQVGRTGLVSPVGELAPVELGGSRIRRVTLHNPRELERRDLRVGDTVWLEKAGEVIPAIVGVEVSQRPGDSVPVPVPEDCPACGGRLEPAGAALYCRAADCGARRHRQLLHFASRPAMALAPLGPRVVRRLVEDQAVETPADLYRLDHDEWVRWIGREGADRMAAALAASRVLPLERLVYALGLPGVGVETARALAQRVDSLAALEAASPGELQAISGLGPAGAARLHAALQDSVTRRLLQELRTVGLGGGAVSAHE